MENMNREQLLAYHAELVKDFRRAVEELIKFEASGAILGVPKPSKGLWKKLRIPGLKSAINFIGGMLGRGNNEEDEGSDVEDSNMNFQPAVLLRMPPPAYYEGICTFQSPMNLRGDLRFLRIESDNVLRTYAIIDIIYSEPIEEIILNGDTKVRAKTNLLLLTIRCITTDGQQLHEVNVLPKFEPDKYKLLHAFNRCGAQIIQC